jgi:hypothetical protein
MSKIDLDIQGTCLYRKADGGLLNQVQLIPQNLMPRKLLRDTPPAKKPHRQSIGDGIYE